MLITSLEINLLFEPYTCYYWILVSPLANHFKDNLSSLTENIKQDICETQNWK